MTAWHRGWQEAVPVDRREVTIGAHRADVVLPDGTVCEVQHSPLRRVEIEARQETYGAGMLWIFDAQKVDDRGRRHAGYALRYRIDGQRQVVDWSWRQRRYALDACAASEVYLDRGDGWLLWVWDRDEDGLLGRGRFVARAFVVGRLNGTEDPPQAPAPLAPPTVPLSVVRPVHSPRVPWVPQPQREPAAHVFQLTPEQEAKREETRAWFRGRVLAAEDALRRGELDVRSADGRLLVKGKLPAASPRAPCVPPTGPSSR